MRYIKKYNEAKELIKDDETYHYIKSVFAELTDDKSAHYSFLRGSKFYVIRVIPDFQSQIENIKAGDQPLRMTPEDFVKRYEYLSELAKDIDVCVKRIMDKYDNLTNPEVRISDKNVITITLNI